MRTTMTLAALCIAASMVEAQTGTIVFEGARVIVGDDSVIEDAVLIVEDGKIQDVGPRGSVSPPRCHPRLTRGQDRHAPSRRPARSRGLPERRCVSRRSITARRTSLNSFESWSTSELAPFEPRYRPRARRVESSRRAACRKHRRRPTPRSRTGVRRAGRRTSRFPARARAVRGRSARARPPPRSGQRRSRRGHDQTLGG